MKNIVYRILWNDGTYYQYNILIRKYKKFIENKNSMDL